MSNNRVWTLERDGSHGSAHLLCVGYSLNDVLKYLEATRLLYHKEEEGWHLQIPISSIHDDCSTIIIELRDGDDLFIIKEWDMTHYEDYEDYEE